jgi:hypothetical protein
MFKQACFIGASLVALALLQPIKAGAATAQITAGGSANPSRAKDATIFQNNVNNSNGAGPGIFAGSNSSTSPRRGLIWFDVYGYDHNVLGDAIANGTINSVTLYLYLGQVAGSGGGGGGGGGSCTGGDSTARVIKLYKVTTGMWGEGTTGSTATGIGGTGQGYAANSGDATWNEYQYNQTPSKAWGAAGGDFSGTVSASSTVSQTCNNAYSWSDPQMKNDVSAWLSTPTTNYGWILKSDSEAVSQSFRAFWTKDAEAKSPSLGTGPILEIDYTP